LECCGLTPPWILHRRARPHPTSSLKPEHSMTPLFQQNVLGNCGTWVIPNLSRLRGINLPL
jgi:hypothetical protein